MAIFSGGKLERPNARLSIRTPCGMHFGVKRHDWSFLVCVGGWMAYICCMTDYICGNFKLPFNLLFPSPSGMKEWWSFQVCDFYDVLLEPWVMFRLLTTIIIKRFLL